MSTMHGTVRADDAVHSRPPHRARDDGAHARPAHRCASVVRRTFDHRILVRRTQGTAPREPVRTIRPEYGACPLEPPETPISCDLPHIRGVGPGGGQGGL
jgi:hypothetical protein